MIQMSVFIDAHLRTLSLRHDINSNALSIYAFSSFIIYFVFLKRCLLDPGLPSKHRLRLCQVMCLRLWILLLWFLPHIRGADDSDEEQESLSFHDLQAEVEATPAAPDLTPFFKALPNLGRRLVVAQQPCIGISGCSWALQGMNAPHHLVHIYDLQLAYLEIIKDHCLEVGMTIEQITLHFGRIEGDLMRTPMLSLLNPSTSGPSVRWPALPTLGRPGM